MKSRSRFVIAGLILSVVSGCLIPGGPSNDPVLGTVLGVEGLADAKKAHAKEKQKEQQAAVNDYLEKKPQ